MYFAILSNKIIDKNLMLVLFLVAIFSPPAFCAILVEEKFNTHLRWNLYVDKKEVLITKTGSGFYIETFELPLYEKLKDELGNIQGDHLGQINFNVDGFPQKPAKIKVALKDETVELFSFYRLRDRKYVLDFWRDQSDQEQSTNRRELAHLKENKTITTHTHSKVIAVANNVSLTKEKMAPKIKSAKKSKSPTKKTIQKYRDFRYGAALIWDYPPLPPKIEKKINIQRKTPEYFYPIEDRNLKKGDDRAAHLQLNINLYRRGKYGLMAKSMKLYGQKYGVDKNHDFNEFLKALALIKENFTHKKRGPFKSAMAILSNIADRTKDYKLKKAIYLYHIQHLMEEKNMVDTLKMGKNLYVESKANSDQKTLNYVAQVIFHALSELTQIEKIKKFAAEKSVQKMLAPQTILAYQVFAHHKENEMKKIISLFQKRKHQMQKPIDPSILYNVAEAYFRNSQYKKAIKNYHGFLKNYGHLRESSFVRVRLALSYEILNSDIAKTIKLYEDAINYSAHPMARYEAKLRYVAIRNTRKIKPNDEDHKVLSFLEHSKDEKPEVNEDLKKLLWIVRLRTFINKQDYRKALSYIIALPIPKLRPTVRRMFEGDGAEIVYGMIVESFDHGDFARVVKLWEIYQEVYENKVAGRPYLNFVVAQSYIALGLEDSSNRIIANLERIKSAPPRKFPIWVPQIQYGSVSNLVTEINVLKMLRKKDWAGIIKNIDRFNITSERKLFYETIALYHSKYFKQVVKSGEEFLRVTPDTLPLNQSETQQFFEAYLESLYNTSKLEKFKKAAKAVLKDIGNSSTSHKGLNGLSEKMSYLLIELLAASPNIKDQLQVETHVAKFLQNYQKSIYLDRIQFLLASNFINHKKKAKGIKILNELVASETASEYIKEMSRSEIASYRLDEKIVN